MCSQLAISDPRYLVGRHLDHNFIQHYSSTLVYDVMVPNNNAGNGTFVRFATWYKISHPGRIKHSGTSNTQEPSAKSSSSGLFLVLEVRLCNLQSSIVDFCHMTGSCQGPIQTSFSPRPSAVKHEKKADTSDNTACLRKEVLIRNNVSRYLNSSVRHVGLEPHSKATE